MTATSTPQVVISYLAQLETALRGVEPGVRDEIVAGIHEELDGLGTAEAAERIEKLGDPEFIAAEARAASPAPTPVPAASAAVSSEPGHGYALFAAVFMMVGSIVIPVLGGVIGLGLVVQTRAWTKLERLVAVLLPVVAVAIVFGASAITSAGAGSSPLVPSTVFTAYVVLVAVFVIEGFALMVRGYSRSWRR